MEIRARETEKNEALSRNQTKVIVSLMSHLEVVWMRKLHSWVSLKCEFVLVMMGIKFGVNIGIIRDTMTKHICSNTHLRWLYSATAMSPSALIVSRHAFNAARIHAPMKISKKLKIHVRTTGKSSCMVIRDQ